jgi:hypothetical protein
MVGFFRLPYSVFRMAGYIYSKTK